MGYGYDGFKGTIDGERLPRLKLGSDGQLSVFEGSPDGKGAYDGQVAFRRAGGLVDHLYIWRESTGTWELDIADGDQRAVKQFRQNVKERTKDKEGFNVAFKTAIAEIGSNSLRYPNDVSTSRNSDFVLFDFFDYQPPFKDNQQFSAQLPDELKGAKANGWFRKDSDYRYFTNELLSQYLRTGQSKNLYKRDETGRFPQIMLYMPDDISDTLKADWEGKAFGSTTAGILSASGTDGIVEKLKSLGNVTSKNIQRAPIEAAASLVTNLAKGITGDTINTGDIFGGISGAIRNPNVEVLFQKMNLRTFDLTFKLIPYNDKEASTIKRIINVFKKSMLPTYQLGENAVMGTKGEDSAAVEASFIKVPKVCKVTYMRGDSQHPDLPTYKMCAITDIGINYTPDGNYAVYTDGTPVAYELKISFMETKLLFSEEIDSTSDSTASGYEGN